MLTVLLSLLLAQVPASAPCSAPEYRQFDFWIGTWEVRGPDGKVAGALPLLLNRTAVLDAGDPVDAGGLTGRSINAYRPWTKTWHQTWVGGDGLVLLLEGGFEGGRMVLAGTSPTPDGPNVRPGATTQNRITWSPLGGGKVRQLWEQSTDGGKTWSVAFEGTYAHAAPSKE
jgi:hypothetical protein